MFRTWVGMHQQKGGEDLNGASGKVPCLHINNPNITTVLITFHLKIVSCQYGKDESNLENII